MGASWGKAGLWGRRHVFQLGGPVNNFGCFFCSMTFSLKMILSVYVCGNITRIIMVAILLQVAFFPNYSSEITTDLSSVFVTTEPINRINKAVFTLLITLLSNIHISNLLTAFNRFLFGYSIIYVFRFITSSFTF